MPKKYPRRKCTGQHPERRPHWSSTPQKDYDDVRRKWKRIEHWRRSKAAKKQWHKYHPDARDLTWGRPRESMEIVMQRTFEMEGECRVRLQWQVFDPTRKRWRSVPAYSRVISNLTPVGAHLLHWEFLNWLEEIKRKGDTNVVGNDEKRHY